MRFLCIIFAIVFINFEIIMAFYSINYYVPSSSSSDLWNQFNNNPLIITKLLTFLEAPDFIQVADIYNRLSGRPPLLIEDQIHLPSINPLVKVTTQQPVILEVFGGVLPSNVTKIISSSAFNSKASNPKLDSILNLLKEINGHEVHSETLVMKEPSSAKTLMSWLANQHSSPVIILHHETPATHHYIKRSLLESKEAAAYVGAVNSRPNNVARQTTDSNNSTVNELSEFQISQYQICLWTALGFVMLLLISICFIVQMDIVPDTLLYAKFQSGRTGKID